MKKQLLLGLMAMTLPLTSWAADGTSQKTGLEVTLTSDALTDGTTEYSGNAVTVTPTVKFYYMLGNTQKSEDLQPGDYEVTYTWKSFVEEAIDKNVASNELKNAGTYTVTVTGKGEAYTGYTATAEFTINRASLALSEDIVKEGAKIQYGTTDEDLAKLDITKFITLSIDNGLKNAGDDLTDALGCLSLTYAAGTDMFVGGATLLHVGENNSNLSTNYEYKGDGVYVRVDIDKKDLALSLKEGIQASAEYSGTAITVTDIVNALDFVEGDKVTANYAITKDGQEVTEIKGAGNYTITVSLAGDNKGNYNLTNDNVSYEVTRKAITIALKEGVELTKTYDGKEMTAEDTKNYFDISGIIEADKNDVKVTVEPSGGTKANVNAGETISLAPYVNRKQVQSGDFKAPKNLDNYYIDYNDGSTTLVKIEITKRTVKYYFAGGEKTYDGEAVPTPEYTVALIEEAGTGFVGTTDGFATEPKAKFAEFAEGVTEAKNAGDYTLTEDTEENENIAFKNDSKNYTAAFISDYTLAEGAEPANVNKYVIKKAEFTARVLDHEIHYAATKEAEENLKAELEDYLTITTGKTGYEGGNLTGKNIVRTSVAGTLVSEMNAIVNQLGKTLVVSEDIDFTKVGEYEIAFAVTAEKVEAQNWNVTLTSGKLFIIGDDEIVLNGGDDPETEIVDLLNIYGGTTVKTVTVKNLMNYVGIDDPTSVEIPESLYAPTTTFEAEKWYLLVLPFDIKVRELSPQLGYAIVNVPDEAKTSSKGAYFKLTMGEVPANTLMAFKVDEETTIPDGLTFSDKKIVAPEGETATATTTINGVDFVGVYAKTTIAGEDDWFMWPYGGGFYQAKYAQMEDRNEEGMAVYPLNGYIHFVYGSSAAARIFMEEADGSTTAINAITGEVIKNATEGWYTIGGVKLNGEPTQKGIYINNGKKVVIK